MEIERKHSLQVISASHLLVFKPYLLADLSYFFHFSQSTHPYNTMAKSRIVFRDVIVVGAGWSGLLACKCVLEEGLTVMALEKRSDVGGLWCFTEDSDVITVMRNTKTTSSSSVTEMSDFPMPEEIGQFPKHEDVLKYLKSYWRTLASEVREWPTVHEQVSDCVYGKRSEAQPRSSAFVT